MSVNKDRVMVGGGPREMKNGGFVVKKLSLGVG